MTPYDAEFFAVVDATLDSFVTAQRTWPKDIASIADLFVTTPAPSGADREYFIAALLGAAVRKLAQ